VWKGSAFGGCKGRTQLPGLVEKYMDGGLDIDRYGQFKLFIASYCTHKFELKDINTALDVMHKGESIRSIIEF
jgi:S-(hydroxymethyl)glutathione dehydrogenase/alcohol dehydrogenase